MQADIDHLEATGKNREAALAREAQARKNKARVLAVLAEVVASSRVVRTNDTVPAMRVYRGDRERLDQILDEMSEEELTTLEDELRCEVEAFAAAKARMDRCTNCSDPTMVNADGGLECLGCGQIYTLHERAELLREKDEKRRAEILAKLKADLDQPVKFEIVKVGEEPDGRFTFGLKCLGCGEKSEPYMTNEGTNMDLADAFKSAHKGH